MKKAILLREQMEKLEAGYQEGLLYWLADVFRHADDVQADTAAVASFQQDSYWNDRECPGYLLRGMFIFVLKAGKTGPRYERACNYSVALKRCWENPLCSPDHVFAHIQKAGGIEALYRQEQKFWAEKKRREHQPPVTPPKNLDGGLPDKPVSNKKVTNVPVFAKHIDFEINGVPIRIDSSEVGEAQWAEVVARTEEGYGVTACYERSGPDEHGVITFTLQGLY